MRTGSAARLVALVGVAFGVGVLVLAWHATTLRLEVDGANLAWPALVAFGIGWGLRRRALWGTGAGLLVGTVASILAAYGSLRFLPITPLGIGIGLGAAAALLAAAVCATRAIPLGAFAVGYGIGVPAFGLAELGPTTGASDVIAMCTAVAFALLVGLLGVRALAVLEPLVVGETADHDEAPPVEIASAERPRGIGAVDAVEFAGPARRRR